MYPILISSYISIVFTSLFMSELTKSTASHHHHRVHVHIQIQRYHINRKAVVFV